MIGLFSEVGILASLINLFIKQRVIWKFVYAVMPLGICMVSLYLSKSASSVLTLVLTLAVVVVAACIAKLPRVMRMITLIGVTVLALLVAAVGAMYDAQDLILHSMGKDHTLTGRTYLWEQGMKNGMLYPVLGHGYQAFWVEDGLKPKCYGTNSAFHRVWAFIFMICSLRRL